MKDALLVGAGAIEGIPVVVAAMEYGFIGGSMGVVMGEKMVRAIEHALDARIGVVIVSCSGGARMMEGALSLMQMAKVSAALARLDRAQLPYLSVLTDPTTGGVTASFAMLGDCNHRRAQGAHRFCRAAHHRADDPPEVAATGFQRSEFLLERGQLDLVVDRREFKGTIARLLRFMGAATTAAPRRLTGSVVGERTRRAAARPRTLRHQARTRRTCTRCWPSWSAAPTFRSLHVAGTNGKGSVSAMVERRLTPPGCAWAATPRRTVPHGRAGRARRRGRE